jgi:hypothetical protein
VGGLIVLLVLAVLMALFAMVAPEPTRQIHGAQDVAGVVAVSEHTSFSASVHNQQDR